VKLLHVSHGTHTADSVVQAQIYGAPALIRAHGASLPPPVVRERGGRGGGMRAVCVASRASQQLGRVLPQGVVAVAGAAVGVLPPSRARPWGAWRAARWTTATGNCGRRTRRLGQRSRASPSTRVLRPPPARRRAPRRGQATALGRPGSGCLRPAPRQTPAPALARERRRASGGLLRRPRVARGPGPRARRLRARRCHAWTSRLPRKGRCSRHAPRAEPAAGQCRQRLRLGRGAGCGASGPARRSGR
jgi:hypothetical protein